MKSIIFLTLLALTLTSKTFPSRINKNEMAPIECIIKSEIITKDIIVVFDAIQKYIEDKDLFSLISSIFTVYPEIENEMKKCLKIDFVLQKSIPPKVQKAWDSIPKEVKMIIRTAYVLFGKREAEKGCMKSIKKEDICNLIFEYIDALVMS